MQYQYIYLIKSVGERNLDASKIRMNVSVICYLGFRPRTREIFVFVGQSARALGQ